MKKVVLIPLMLSYLLVTGCVVAPQAPITLADSFWEQQEKKLGVVMTGVPVLDVYLPGAGCLLCMAVAEGANSDLSDHVATLTAEDVPELGKKLTDSLNARGVDTVLINEKLNYKALPANSSKAPGSTKKNFTKYGQKYGLSHLIVIDIRMLGMHRSYSSYVPTSDPKAVFAGAAYIVDVATNTYSAYKPVEIYTSVSDNWKEPPSFPGLTNAYYQTLEMGKDAILTAFDTQESGGVVADSGGE